MAPVAVKPDTPIFQEHPEWFCRGTDGELLCRVRMYYLDPTHPDVRKFILDNYRYQYRAGFKLFKIDFLSPLLDAKSFYDKNATPYGVIADLIADVKACTGPDVVVLGCSLPPECGADIAPSMRIGLDTHNYFPHVASISRTIAWAWMYNNKVTRIDPDFLVVRGEETSTEAPDTTIDNHYYIPPRHKQTDTDRFGVIWRNGEQFNAIEAETWANMVAISGGKQNLYTTYNEHDLYTTNLDIVRKRLLYNEDAYVMMSEPIAYKKLIDKDIVLLQKTNNTSKINFLYNIATTYPANFLARLAQELKNAISN
jgi:hypothetical protein